MAATLIAASLVAQQVNAHQTRQDAKGEMARQKREQNRVIQEKKDRQAFEEKGRVDTEIRDNARAVQKNKVRSGGHRGTILTGNFDTTSGGNSGSGGKTYLGA